MRNSDETLLNVYFQETMEDMSAFPPTPPERNILFT